MSGDSSLQTLFSDSDDLRGEYTGLDDVYRAEAVVTPDGEKFHRPAADEEVYPACRAERGDDWRLIDTDDARKARFAPCRGCWKPIFDYLAGEADSDVERVDDEAVATDHTRRLAADGGLDAIAGGGDERLASPTEDVLIASRSSVFHAPTGGGPLCGETADMRRVDRAVLAGQRRPCRECFDLDDE